MIDSRQDFFLSSKARDHGHVSGQSKINVERSGLWILASSEHDINKKFLILKMVSVINDTVVDDLSHEANW
jgi:hypothetical protein